MAEQMAVSVNCSTPEAVKKYMDDASYLKQWLRDQLTPEETREFVEHHTCPLEGHCTDDCNMGEVLIAIAQKRERVAKDLDS